MFETSLTIEDWLELVAGISQLKYHNDPDLSKLQNFKLHEDNHKIMFSIAKQVMKGMDSDQQNLVELLLNKLKQEQKMRLESEIFLMQL